MSDCDIYTIPVRMITKIDFLNRYVNCKYMNMDGTCFYQILNFQSTFKFEPEQDCVRICIVITIVYLVIIGLTFNIIYFPSELSVDLLLVSKTNVSHQ